MKPILYLKTVGPKGESHNGFKWPLKVGAKVTAKDWNDRKECGGGLHGLRDGAGDGSLLNWSDDAKWIVFQQVGKEAVDLNGKWKIKTAKIVHFGTRLSATRYLVDRGAVGVVGGSATAGDGGSATAGDGGSATAGNMGTATAGDGGSATAGDGGSATAGNCGSATAGDGGSATAGDGGSATAGNMGTATAGYGGTATAGDRGTATAGDRGTATAGDRGVILIHFYDGKLWRIKCGMIGENGLKPNTKYKLDDAFNFVEAA